MRVVTVNVNGIRAAARKGGLAELRLLAADIITFQEVRSSSAQLAEVLGMEGLQDWSAVHAPCDQSGRNGTAVVSAEPITDAKVGLPGFATDGRWIEATTTVAGRSVVVVSAYVPKGHAGEPPQEQKMRFLAAASRRMSQLSAGEHDVLVTGDLNIARTEQDLKNWKQRIGKSGFLIEERAYLDDWEALGWVDVGQALAGDGPGPYTWWSQRGRAFDNDVGWRIDYIWATPDLGARASGVSVVKAQSWDSRWSDHAPVVVDFD